MNLEEERGIEAHLEYLGSVCVCVELSLEHKDLWYFIYFVKKKVTS